MSFFSGPKSIAVTIDFLRKIEGLDVTEEIQLKKALQVVGFKVESADGKNVNIGREVSLVRCKDRPYEYRQTMVFRGTMREDFMFKSLYEDVDILDVGGVEGVDEVINLPFELPTVDRANTRKYTRKNSVMESLEMSATDLKVLAAKFS